MKDFFPVLVTGGAGYIGSHVCKILSRSDYTPVTYDNLVYGHRWAVKWGPLEEGDLFDRARLDQVIRQYSPQAVMHFAAYAYVGESVENPGKYYRNNVLGTLNLLEAMRDHNIDKIIFSSTCAVYGIPEKVPITENDPKRPINPYGATKLMIEQMLHDFHVAHGIRFISLRYFNAAGADPEGEIGEDHNPETHLIPLVLDVALGRTPYISVFGDDYPTQDGTCIRDYIHVMDLAQAHVLALKRLEAGGESASYNLGNGLGFSVREVIETARRVTRKDIPSILAPRRSGDPAVLIGDARRAFAELGWRPRFASLESQIKHAWEWHRKHFSNEEEI